MTDEVYKVLYGILMMIDVVTTPLMGTLIITPVLRPQLWLPTKAEASEGGR